MNIIQRSCQLRSLFECEIFHKIEDSRSLLSIGLWGICTWSSSNHTTIKNMSFINCTNRLPWWFWHKIIWFSSQMPSATFGAARTSLRRWNETKHFNIHKASIIWLAQIYRILYPNQFALNQFRFAFSCFRFKVEFENKEARTPSGCPCLLIEERN